MGPAAQRDHRPGDFEQASPAEPLIGRPHHQRGIGSGQRVGDLDHHPAAALVESLDRLAQIERHLIGTGSAEMDAVVLARAHVVAVEVGPEFAVLAVLARRSGRRCRRTRRPPPNAASRWMLLIWPIALEYSDFDIGGRPTQISGLLAPRTALTKLATRVLVDRVHSGVSGLAASRSLSCSVCRSLIPTIITAMSKLLAATCSVAVLFQSKKSGRTKPDEPTPWLITDKIGVLRVEPLQRLGHIHGHRVAKDSEPRCRLRPSSTLGFSGTGGSAAFLGWSSR